MATLTSTPAQTREGESILFFTVGNVLDFSFSAGVGETSLQLQVCDSGGVAQVTLKNLPFDTADALTINLAPFLQTFVNADDSTDNTRLQTGFGVATGKTYQFTLKYRANGTGSYTSIGSTYTAVMGARQLGSAYGATLAEYLPLLSGSPAVVDYTGQWLTRFDRPVLFWYSDKANPASASDVSVWYGQLAFPLTTDDYTDIDLLRARWYAGGSLIATDESDDVGTTAQYITASVPNAEQYVWQAQEVVLDAGIGDGGSPPAMDSVAVDAITVEVRRACNNPFAIKWLNSLGAWECWVFEGRTPRSLDVESESGAYGIEVRDVKTATESRREFRKQAQGLVELVADQLTLGQAKALEEIYTSPNVLYYAGDLTAGSAFGTWYGCTVEAGTFASYDSYNTKHRMQLQVRLKDEYIVSN